MLSLLSFAALAVTQQSPLRAPTAYAIVGADVVCVSGPTIGDGVVIVRDGEIVAVGTPAATPIPADATVVRAEGMTVYPGFIDAFGSFGMPGASDAVYDAADFGAVHPNGNVRPERRAMAYYRPDSGGLETRRRYGFTAANVAIPNGIWCGETAVVALGSKSPSQSIVRAEGRQVLDLGAANRRRSDAFGYPNSLMGAIALARQSLYDAKGPHRPSDWNSSVEPLARVLSRGELFAVASDSRQAARVLRLADEFSLRPTLVGCVDAVRLIGEATRRRTRPILTLEFPEPILGYDPDAPPTLGELRERAVQAHSAFELAKAGVPFAFGTWRAASERVFWRNVRTTVANGLPPEKAVRALTLGAAEALGIEDRVGSIQVGRRAHLILCDGDLFQSRPPVKKVFVGEEVFDIDPPRWDEDDEDVRPRRPDLIDEHDHEGDSCCLADLEAGLAQRRRGGAQPRLGRWASNEAPVYSAASLDPVLPLPTKGDWLLRGGTVWTLDRSNLLEATDVLLRNGKIAAVGKGLEPEGATVIDVSGMHVTPGLIDCHSHTAISGGVNDGSKSCTVEVRIRDVIDSFDEGIYHQLAGGTTSANLLHGSANTMGGQNAVVKWRWGASAEEMVFTQAPEGVKFALGENVTAVNWRDRDPANWRYPTSRMGVEQLLRDRFQAAREYETLRRQGTVARNLQLEAVLEILRGTRYVHCHCYRQSEILMLMRVAEEYGFRIRTFQHNLEGYKVADEMAAHGVGSSCFTDWWGFKFESYDAIPWHMKICWERGVNVSINSDSGDHARRLNLEAAKAVKYGGVPAVEALKMVSLNPAQQLGIDRYVGSIEVGKHADVAVWSDNPLSTASRCELTFVDGAMAFARSKDEAARAGLAEEHKKRLAELKVSEPLATLNQPASLAPDFSAAEWRSTYPKGRLAIMGGTVHPVSGPPIPRGTVLVVDAKIAAVGADVRPPSGTPTIDARGKHVYPGLIDAYTQIGLSEIGQMAATVDQTEMGDLNPNARAAVAVNPDSEFIPVTRLNGVTAAVSAPTGGVLSGQGCVVALDGYTWEEMCLATSIGLFVSLPDPPTNPTDDLDDRRREYDRRLKELERFVDDARRYDRARNAGAEGARDERLEAMGPVLAGRRPVFVVANSAVAIKAALHWCERHSLQMVLVGGAQAAEVAPLLRERGVPVVYTGSYGFPLASERGYDYAFAAPARLKEAGVRFCIATGGNMDSRNLAFHAGRAAAYGLSRSDALRAVTLSAAEVLGLGHRLGSIDVGKDAHLLVTDGDPLDVRTQVLRVVIAGRSVPMESKQTRLADRYGSRPRR